MGCNTVNSFKLSSKRFKVLYTLAHFQHISFAHYDETIVNWYSFKDDFDLKPLIHEM